MNLPAVPDADELNTLWRVADLLAKSGMVPQAYRGKPADVLSAALYGRELGLGPTTSMQYLSVISGRPTLSAEGRVALIRRAGHSITGESTPERAVARGRRVDSGDEMTVEWTIGMAKRAGLVRSSGPWAQYPEAMLWARAVSQLSRMLFPDVLMGVSYDPSEVDDEDGGGREPVRGAVVDVVAGDGGRVDTATGEIVAGEADQEPERDQPTAALLRAYHTAWSRSPFDDDDRRLIQKHFYAAASSKEMTREQLLDVMRRLSDQDLMMEWWDWVNEMGRQALARENGRAEPAVEVDGQQTPAGDE